MRSSNKNFFRVGAEDFKKIPDSPITYWPSNDTMGIFTKAIPLSSVADVRHGLSIGKNEAEKSSMFSEAIR